MRLLVLGGTVFLSATVAEEGVRRGHAVTCASRGLTGSPPPGARFVRWDRSDDPPADLGDHDAVVDVTRVPSQARSAVAAVPEAHWVFVSSISAYADAAEPGGGPGRTPLLAPVHDDLDPTSSPEAYGAMKVACEEAITAGAASATVVRPGLIVGPGDPSGRFAYWPRRFARPGEVLAPGRPDDGVQVVDVRDLAGWLVDLAEGRTVATVDAVGPVEPLAGVLASMAPDADLTWVDQDFLAEHGVQPWTGPDSIPLWLPRPAYDGLLAHDPEPAHRLGLRTRPVADTARDTAAWLASDAAATVTGIGADRERDLLAAWHDRPR
ncbi:hypothetical protein KUV85_07445 [Nocardioides panacisoli]|uniref:NAD-dependent epimerase/dehydratase family protein n=1 Tax=Nocardioides panacisoli TaxID=627624 RepID=UPI001C625FB6|nr:NAD-dependent epimerase/dehydratase family protein [Nocardioides panacisoli]QYJ05504.1 hypothetical protein KUV85_07445 [Nocardioides panacisoli]